MDWSSFAALLPPWWPQWALLVGGGVVALLLLVGLWRVLRRARPAPSAAAARNYDIRADLFARTVPITDEQIALLHYLQKAFPGEGVLFRPRLSHFLAPRKARQRQAALLRLAGEQVDFLICDRDGKPLFAFDADSSKAANDPVLKRSLADKNLMLKTAGIRLVRLKGVPANWPAPEVLRRRMLAVQQPAPAAHEGQPSGFGPSGFGPSGFAQTKSFSNSGYAPNAPTPSNPMGLSTLMGVPLDERNSAWGGVRKRS